MFAPAQFVQVLSQFLLYRRQVLVGIVELPVLAGQLLFDAVALLRVAYRPHERLTRQPALHEIVLRSFLECRKTGLFVVKPGQDHDRNTRRVSPHGPDRSDTLAVREMEVEKNEIDPSLVQDGERGREILCGFDPEIKPLEISEQFPYQFQICGAILDHQDPHAHSPHRGGSVTIENQKSSIDWTILMNSSNFNGFRM